MMPGWIIDVLDLLFQCLFEIVSAFVFYDHVIVSMFVSLLCFCVVKCYSDNVLFFMLSCVMRSVFAMDMLMPYMLL